MQLYTAVVQRVPYDGPYHVLITKKREFSPQWPTALNYAGQWVLPGGAKESGDTSDRAGACREFFEETGIDLGQIPRIAEKLQNYGERYAVLFIYTDVIDKLIESINYNINHPKEGMDKELAQVAKITVADAIHLFAQPWEAISHDAQGSLQSGKRNRYGESREWFVEALEDFGMHYDTWGF